MTRTLFGSRRMPRAFALTIASVALAGGVASGCGGGDKNAVAPATTAQPTTTVQQTTTAGEPVADGARIFAENCESCHGQLGAGGHVGPNLQKSPVAGQLALVEKQVRNGGGAMPPFSGVLSSGDIDAVAHYVVEQIAPRA
jgi:mono/diheme cytochrome c family protein